MFQKGVSGNPGGRAKGAKNKSYLSLKYWFEMVADNSRNLPQKEKIEIAFRAINVLAPKVQSLPAEPGDSVENAIRAQNILNALENQPARPNGAQSLNGDNGANPHT